MLISTSVVDILHGFFILYGRISAYHYGVYFQGVRTCSNLQNIGEAVSSFQQNPNSLFYKSLHAYMTYSGAYYALAMISIGLSHVLTAVLHIVTLRILDILFKEVQM